MAELRFAEIDFGEDVDDIAALLPDAFLDIHFKRVAVTPEQIESMKLPTRPTKRTDTRVKNFDGESVEVDAIPPKELRKIVSDCITQHIDHDAYEVLQQAEAGEREVLMAMARNYASASEDLPF